MIFGKVGAVERNTIACKEIWFCLKEDVLYAMAVLDNVDTVGCMVAVYPGVATGGFKLSVPGNIPVVLTVILALFNTVSAILIASVD